MDRQTGAAVSCSACEAGRWGATCHKTCAQGQCSGTVTCDQVSGSALTCSGCAAGRCGPTCGQTCSHTGCDGTVTCEEWRQYAGKLFDEADTARKGHLTPDDFRRLAGTDRLFDVANFAWFDADRDGRITRAELVDRPNPAFRILDRNGDCALGQDELLRAGGGDQTVGGDVGIGGHASRRR